MQVRQKHVTSYSNKEFFTKRSTIPDCSVTVPHDYVGVLREEGLNTV